MNTLEVILIGKKFNPLHKSGELHKSVLINAEVATALNVGGELLDYCNDEGVALDALETLGCAPFVKPTPEGGWVCILGYEGEVYVTKPFKKETHAIACALYFVACENKSVVT